VVGGGVGTNVEGGNVTVDVGDGVEGGAVVASVDVTIVVDGGGGGVVGSVVVVVGATVVVGGGGSTAVVSAKSVVSTSFAISVVVLAFFVDVVVITVVGAAVVVVVVVAVDAVVVRSLVSNVAGVAANFTLSVLSFLCAVSATVVVTVTIVVSNVVDILPSVSALAARFVVTGTVTIRVVGAKVVEFSDDDATSSEFDDVPLTSLSPSSRSTLVTLDSADVLFARSTESRSSSEAAGGSADVASNLFAVLRFTTMTSSLEFSGLSCSLDSVTRSGRFVAARCGAMPPSEPRTAPTWAVLMAVLSGNRWGPREG